MSGDELITCPIAASEASSLATVRHPSSACFRSVIFCSSEAIVDLSAIELNAVSVESYSSIPKIATRWDISPPEIKLAVSERFSSGLIMRREMMTAKVTDTIRADNITAIVRM